MLILPVGEHVLIDGESVCALLVSLEEFGVAMRISILFVSGLLMGCCDGLVAQASLGTWVDTGAAIPVTGGLGLSMRSQIAYDRIRDVVVVYGPGAGSTWEFDGSAWHAVSTQNYPQSVNDASMTYVDSIGKVMLFGGGGAGVGNETWFYDGVDWVLDTQSFRPSPRQQAGLAYDALGDRVILYGGYSASGPLADTWAWSASTGWYPIFGAVNPGGRAYFGMCYAGPEFGVVMHGGDGWNGQNRTTWSLMGNIWRRVPTGLWYQAYHSLVWDPLSGFLHAVGGYGSNVHEMVFTAEGWFMPRTAGVSPPSGAACVFDSARQRFVCVDVVSGRTFAFDLNAVVASGVPFGLGCGAQGAALAQVSGGEPRLGGMAVVQASNCASGVGLLAYGVSNSNYGSIPLPSPLFGAGMGGCELLVSIDGYVVGQAAASGIITFGVSVPSIPDLLGAKLYAQAFVVESGANSAGLVVTNGIDWTFGNR